ncbi:5-methylcytosine-specific restriction endonuclease system specificity protein McrC [Methylobacterium sp. E-046]|uniref:5-methylcytosine-specific restriction endonuclease system specificity protein McrC n=1 Tax=Methylobacterium sp. E-046 TaxID=2836576 RepID=UPI001FBACD78|nr:5-methylcytosine-specific restriction endonuclease system specificity protein McrC [Methylobacterium sp. E-046]MCJ2099461.1 5-methylcytosine-specific restriction endonuclease system specificity protein McrC [Methylobacterium sp. E-046]
MSVALAVDEQATWRSHGGIPVRNLWMLLVYAADLAGFLDRAEADVDEETELPELLAILLATVVERRLRRSLSRGYRMTEAALPRVRGRIDWLATESGSLLRRGLVACRFEELTNDTPRNRLVRTALERMSAVVPKPELSRRCGALARTLAAQGVGSKRPTRSEFSKDQVARHDVEDRLMVAVATMALDLLVPAEAAGDVHLTRLDRDERLLRRIFEKAVAGFYRHELGGTRSVRVQLGLSWDMAAPTPNLTALLPGMQADVILEDAKRRTVIDTKFTGILTARPYGGESFKSPHLYQMYAYLRSQAGRGDMRADTAQGVLLHPSLDRHVDESVTIQGHRVRFATVDLARSGADVRGRLLEIAGA